MPINITINNGITIAQILRRRYSRKKEVTNRIIETKKCVDFDASFLLSNCFLDDEDTEYTFMEIIRRAFQKEAHKNIHRAFGDVRQK